MGRRTADQAPLFDRLTLDGELCSGPELSTLLAGERDRLSLFRSDAERKADWEAERERIIDELAARLPGRRPWAWWHYEAGQEEPREKAQAVAVIASRGELTDTEAKTLRERGDEARVRIDTDAERCTIRSDGSRIGPDRDAVAVATAIEVGTDAS